MGILFILDYRLIGRASPGIKHWLRQLAFSNCIKYHNPNVFWFSWILYSKTQGLQSLFHTWKKFLWKSNEGILHTSHCPMQIKIWLLMLIRTSVVVAEQDQPFPQSSIGTVCSLILVEIYRPGVKLRKLSHVRVVHSLKVPIICLLDMYYTTR